MTIPKPPAHLRGNVSYETIKPFVVSCLSEEDPSSPATLSVMESLTCYLDCTYFILRHLHDLFKATKLLEKPSQFYANSLVLMELILSPSRKPTEHLGKTPAPKSDLARHTRPSYLRHYFTQVWLQFLDNQLSDSQILDAIRRLGDSQLNRLQDARLLADHVIPIFDPAPRQCPPVGGRQYSAAESTCIPPSWSRSAARTVLGLLHKGGLDYPRVYTRLYGLLDDSLLTCPDAERFLDDLDVYLSSLHLAANVVASFIKRLAQLALRSPLRLTASILLTVLKSLQRHPKCKRLIHRPSDRPHQSIETQDAYSWDPAAVVIDFDKTNALQSSLWEVTALQHHYSPGVASLALAICQPSPSGQWLTVTAADMLPSQLVRCEDAALREAGNRVHKSLLMLANSNCQMPELKPLDGWR